MDNSRARQAFCHSYKSIYAAMVMRECRSWVWAQLLVLFHLPRLLLSVLCDLIIATHCKKTKLNPIVNELSYCDNRYISIIAQAYI